MRLLNRIFGRVQVRQQAPTSATRGAEGDAEIDDAFLSRLRRAVLSSERRFTSGVTGEHASHRKASALEFADYRSYTPGDDLRRVDWNAYLRLDHLFVKLADAPERIALHLLLDGSRSMAWGQPEKFAYARRVAIGLAYVALSHMDTASLMLLRDRGCVRLSQLESSAATATMVRSLASVTPEGSTDLDASLRSFSTQGSHRGMAVLISDLLSPAGYQQGLERLLPLDSSGRWCFTCSARRS